MLVERSCEVHIKMQTIVETQADDPSSKSEIVQMIGIDFGIATRLKRCTLRKDLNIGGR